MTDEDRAVYNRTLNIDASGVMGYIKIPKIDVTLPIYHSTDENVLQTSIGHMEESSLPVGGESTHCLLSGHRGLPSARLFTDLDKLREGDTFTMTILNETLTYEVDHIWIVEPSDLSHLAIEKGKDYCTLITCTLYGINTHRLLVRGHRTKNADGNAMIVADAIQIRPVFIAPFLAIPILALLLVYLLISTSANRRRKRDLKAEYLSEHRLKEVALAFCLLLILPFLAPMTASAAEDAEFPDPDRTGSVSATFTYYDEKSGKTYPVTGGSSVGLYKVANVVVDDGFKFVVDERFAAVGEIPATDEELDKANAELAEKMAAIASGYEFDEAPQKMDSEGRVSFGGLSIGLYLVMQAEKGTGDKEFTITPFLVSIPYRNADGSLLYDVDASAKPTTVTKHDTTPPPPPPPKRIPQTGQLWWPVMVLGIAGALFVLAGVAAKVRK